MSGAKFLFFVLLGCVIMFELGWYARSLPQ